MCVHECVCCMCVYGCVGVRACARAHVCTCECMHECICVCGRVCTRVRARACSTRSPSPGGGTGGRGWGGRRTISSPLPPAGNKELFVAGDETELDLHCRICVDDFMYFWQFLLVSKLRFSLPPSVAWGLWDGPPRGPRLSLPAPPLCAHPQDRCAQCRPPPEALGPPWGPHSIPASLTLRCRGLRDGDVCMAGSREAT